MKYQLNVSMRAAWGPPAYISNVRNQKPPADAGGVLDKTGALE